LGLPNAKKVCLNLRQTIDARIAKRFRRGRAAEQWCLSALWNFSPGV
jgi:hypothetical protein